MTARVPGEKAAGNGPLPDVGDEEDAIVIALSVLKCMRLILDNTIYMRDQQDALVRRIEALEKEAGEVLGIVKEFK